MVRGGRANGAQAAVVLEGRWPSSALECSRWQGASLPRVKLRPTTFCGQADVGGHLGGQGAELVQNPAPPASSPEQQAQPHEFLDMVEGLRATLLAVIPGIWPSYRSMIAIPS